jgi:uncharacterized DUF497 family protein
LIEFDPQARTSTLVRRGLDFKRAVEVFAGQTFRFTDERFDHDEERTVAFGTLDARWVIVVWTQRGAALRGGLFQ